MSSDTEIKFPDYVPTPTLNLNSGGMPPDLNPPSTLAQSSSYSLQSSSRPQSQVPQLKVPENGPSLLPPAYKANRSGSLSRSPSRARSLFTAFRRNSMVKEDYDEFEENELFKSRDEGWNAGVFGFTPNFPTPPKYIWVHAHKKRNREFTRMFLAQELGENRSKLGSRRRSSSSDSKTSNPPDSKNGKKAVWCAKFSLDGQFLATAGADCVIRIWKVLSNANDRVAFDLSDLSDDDESLQYTQSSMTLQPSIQPSSQSRSRRNSYRRHAKPKKQIVSAPVFLPKPVIEYLGHTQEILDICWSKNNFLLSSSMDKTVKLWHPEFKDSIKTFVHKDFVTSIAFHPHDDRFFISGSLDCRLRLWSITENKVEYQRDAPDLAMAVAFSPDGNTAVAGCFGGQCMFYETEGLRQKSQMIVKSSHGRNSNGSRITGIQILEMPPLGRSPESGEAPQEKKAIKLLISTGDSRIRMYNFENKTFEAKFKGHTSVKGHIPAFFSDSGEYIISGSEDENTYIWRTNAEPRLAASKKRDESYEYFHSNRAIVSVALFAPLATRTLLFNSRDPIYDLAAPPSVDSVTDSNSQSSIYDSIKPNPSDGNIIITCDKEGCIKVFRQDSAYEQRKIATENVQNLQRKKTISVNWPNTHSHNQSFETRSLQNLSLSPITTNIGNGSDRNISPSRARAKSASSSPYVQTKPNDVTKKADTSLSKENQTGTAVNGSTGEEYIKCPTCGGSDFKVKPTANGPAFVCTVCGD